MKKEKFYNESPLSATVLTPPNKFVMFWKRVGDFFAMCGRGIGIVFAKLHAWRVLTYLLLIIFSIIVAYPILWSIMSSFKTTSEIQQSPFTFPHRLQWVNYANAWNAANMGGYFLNSIVTTGLGLILIILLAVPTSYVLSRFRFKFRGVLKIILMAGLFINVSYIVYPIFLMVNDLGKLIVGNGLAFTDSLITVAFVNAVCAVPFCVYLLSGFMSQLPTGYEEAAKIDGCGHFKTLIKVVAPLCLPSILTVILFQFLAYWNEYIVSITFLSTVTRRTLPVGLLSIMEEAKVATDYGRMYAGLVIVMLPVLVLYCFVQGQLTKGMSVGGLKG